MMPNRLPGYYILCCVLLTQACQPSTRQFQAMDPGDTGLKFENTITETQENNILTYQYMYNGAGLAAGDVNHDGLPDLYISGNSVPNKLFLNRGAWRFEDVTQQASVQDRAGDWKTGVTMADVNGDGWLDIYVCYSGNTTGEGYRQPVIAQNPHRNNQLFINKGCEPGGIPIFEESAKAYGIDAPGTFSIQGYFFDYDRDGDLDMFLVNHANTFYSSLFNTTKLRSLRHPFFGNKLYRHDSTTFTEVSAQAGIHGSGLNYGLSAAITDINADGWPDIYVTNDYDEQDFCYLNRQDGTFREISHHAFGHLSKYSMGTDAADINNDGRPDLCVVDMLPEDNHRQKLLKGADQYDKYTLAVDSGYHHQNMRNTLQINLGVDTAGYPRFAEVGQQAGISNTDWSWAPLFADLDNDGLKDLIITNGYLHDYTNLDFLKYVQGELSGTLVTNTESADLMTMIRQMPSTKISSYVMRNTDGIHFENVTAAWGLSQPSVANGAAYADFDNDGDLDMVLHKLNEPVSLYQNKLVTQNHFIKINLAGSGSNTYGIGAKVWIKAAGRNILQEVFTGRGYASAVEPVLTIGIGSAQVIDEIRVAWPDGKESVLQNVQPDQTLQIQQQHAVVAKAGVTVPTPVRFHDELAGSGIDFRHIENNFIDFKVQRLIPYQVSRVGSRLAVGDVNADGHDDIYFGGAVGQPGVLYLGSKEGAFHRAASQPWQADALCEDIGAAFFDADGDGDHDLYVVSGGNEFGSGDPLYHDRLYRNEGGGTFAKAGEALPAKETTSGSCVVPADYDHDGDLDLFIGGRVAAQLYPITPRSFVLRNDTGGGVLKFTDVTESLNNDLGLAGMVTDAVWSDINGDNWPDLLLAGEWMPVRVFQNSQGKKLTEITDAIGLGESNGWWSKIVAADVDNDGDTDFLLGNAGINQQLRASPAQPLEYFVADVNDDGGPDPILCYYVQGKRYPVATMDELVDQVRSIRKKFNRYADYADAGIEQIMNEAQLRRALRLRINTLQSAWLENTGSGKLVLKPLPMAVQVSMINGFVLQDFDGDGENEVLCAGNFFPYKVEWGRSDAFTGALLKFRNGQATVYRPETPLWLSGDIRDMAVVGSRTAGSRIVVARNNDRPGLFRYKSSSRP